METLLQVRKRESNIGRRLAFEVDGDGFHYSGDRVLDYKSQVPEHISVQSPVGEALKWMCEGESVTTTSPGGNITVTLLKIYEEEYYV